MELEQVKPQEIEKRSFEIITELLGEKKLDPENALVIKRAIHTTADFDYADHLKFSPHAVKMGMEAIRQGASIVTDTNMGKAGSIKRNWPGTADRCTASWPMKMWQPWRNKMERPGPSPAWIRPPL